jgi:hypothetical protein
MAKQSKYSIMDIAAIAGGLALTSVEVVGSVSYLLRQSQPSYLVAGGAIITVVAAGLPLLAEHAWQISDERWPSCCGRHCSPRLLRSSALR